MVDKGQLPGNNCIINRNNKESRENEISKNNDISDRVKKENV